MRLDKFLSNSGYGSRKEVKAYIKKGLVTVDGVVVKKDDFQIDENKNKVVFDGEEVIFNEFYYVLINKPKGCVCALEDNLYPCVTDIPEEYKFAKLFPVGRLDLDTTGTLLLTNNGPLCHKLLAPKYHVDKTYYVEVDGKIKPEMVNAFREGIILDGEKTLPGELVILSDNTAELTIHQGKFHQVKRMFQHFKLNVTRLDRKTFAFLNHEDLEEGEYRELTPEEIEKLLEL